MAKKYKLNILEKMAAAGWLDYGNRKYSAVDRLSAGARLWRDFYLGGLTELRANDLGKIKVDGGGSGKTSDRRLDFRNAYEKACRAVPSEFWQVVRQVVVEDKPLKAEGSERQVKYELYRQRVDLCRGLDRLIEHYLGIKKAPE